MARSTLALLPELMLDSIYHPMICHQMMMAGVRAGSEKMPLCSLGEAEKT
jgi:hypothetical protein